MFVSDLERCHKRAGGAFTLNGGIAPFQRDGPRRREAHEFHFKELIPLAADCRFDSLDPSPFHERDLDPRVMVASSRARSCMSDTPAVLLLPRVAAPEAPSCKWIDLAQNH